MRYNPKECGRRIQILRKRADLTQEQLAEAVHISTSTLGKIERGTQGISIDLLIEFSIFFSVSLDYIVIDHETNKEAITEKLRLIKQILEEVEKRL